MTKAMAEVVQHGVYIFEMDEVSFRVFAFGCARGEGIADGCRPRDLLAAACDFALGELEMLDILAQLVQLSDEQRHRGASLLHREVAAVQNAQVVIDIGSGDVSVHDVLPRLRRTVK